MELSQETEAEAILSEYTSVIDDWFAGTKYPIIDVKLIQKIQVLQESQELCFWYMNAIYICPLRPRKKNELSSTYMRESYGVANVRLNISERVSEVITDMSLLKIYGNVGREIIVTLSSQRTRLRMARK